MNTTGKFNRSFSEPELNTLNLENLYVQNLPSIRFERNVPYIKKTVLIVEEVFHNSSMVLRNGQSIPDQLHNIENICSKHSVSNNCIVNSDILSNTSHLKGEIWSSVDNGDGITPMDVDIVSSDANTEGYWSTVQGMDVEDTDYHIYKTGRLNSIDKVLKKRNLKEGVDTFEKVPLKDNKQIKTVPSKKKQLRCNSTVLAIVSISLSILLSLWFFQDSSIYFNDVDVQRLEKDLLENVYEQKACINTIVQSLEQQYNWPNKIKVLGFVGSTGVGKSFVANILKKHFHPRLVHEIYGMQLNFQSQWEHVLFQLKSCCLNLIIIDDLNKNNALELAALVNALPKNIYILVVSIFSIQDSDDKLNYVINYNDIDEIRQEFENARLFYELVQFHEFNLFQVKDWLEKQLKVQNVRYSEKLISNVLYNHNVLYEGLKGLHSKLLLEIEALR